jgi:hypothetical protein
VNSASLTKEKTFSSTLTKYWHTPTVTVARFVLLSHFRSGWIIGDLVFIWLLYAVLFLEFGGDVSYFYGTAGQGLSVLAILSTIVILSRSLNARMYLPIARLSSRGAYIRGIILATGCLRIPSFLLMLLLGGSIHMHQPDIGDIASRCNWTSTEYNHPLNPCSGTVDTNCYPTYPDYLSSMAGNYVIFK